MAQVAVPRDRRSVTILFADIVGSTALIERADAESVHRLLAPAIQDMADAVERHSGHVSEVQGDGILAIFGAPNGLEDHPLQACRAALAIQSAIRSRTAGPQKLAVRIGLSSGVVVVTVEGEGPSTTCHAVGIPVHLASRVQAETPPGRVGISRHVHDRVRHDLETELLGQFHLKGISTVESIFLLRGPIPEHRAAEDRQAGRSPFVGREIELNLLGDRFASLKAGLGGVVVLEGEAGVGKSRLLLEARRKRPPGLAWFAGNCHSHEQRLGYKPFIDMVGAWLRAATGTACADWRSFAEKMDAFLGEDGPHTTPYIGTLLGIEIPPPWDERVRYLSPDRLGNQVRGAMRRFFQRQALAAPLVITLEDFHWADESSAGLLEHLLPLTVETPLLFVLTTRPQADAVSQVLLRARELDGKNLHVVLGPLGSRESTALLEHYIPASAKTKYLRQEILAKTGGNPFFIEELAHSIRASAATSIVTDATLGRPRELVAVPETVQEVILSRVDRLKVGSRHLLMRAAVIGREFLERVLRTLEDARTPVDRQLIDLEHRQFIREVARTPELAYVFCHALTQQTIYDSILIETRKQLHRRVADALDSIYSGRRAEIASVLAFHYARADARDKALECLLQAAGESEKISADAEAVRHYEDALQAYEAADQGGTKWQQAFIRRRLGVLHSRRGNFERAESYFLSALALYGDRFPLPGMPARMALAGQVARHLLTRLIRRTSVPTEDATDEANEQHMRAYEGLAWLMMQTDQDRMLYATLRVLNLSERTPWRESAAKASGAVGFACNVLGKHKVAERYHRRARAIAEQSSDLGAQALVTDLYGGHCLFIGAWDEALESLKRAQELAFRIGDLDTWASACGWQCVLLCERGELAEVQSLARGLRAAGRDTGFAVADRWGRLFEGAWLRRAGRTGEAEAWLRQSLDAATACGDVVTQVDALGELGVLALRAGKNEAGAAYLRMGMDLVRQRRIRIQSIVPIHVGLAEAAIPAPGNRGARDQTQWRALKRRCTRALGTARRYSLGSAWALRLLARVHWLGDDQAASERYWQQAIDISERLKSRYELALTLSDRGNMMGDECDTRSAKALLDRCTEGLSPG